MARYTEKDRKEKDKKAPADTYAAPKAADPAGYGRAQARLNAREDEESGRRSCSLTVVVSDDTTGDPIYKAQVTISMEGLHETLETDHKGKVHRSNLPPGDYEVEVAHHEYQPEPKRESVTLTGDEEADEDAKLHIRLRPEKATLYVQAFHDAKRCGDPEGQDPLSVHIDVLADGAILASAKTRDDGIVCLPLNYTGWVTVRPVGNIKYEGKLLVPEGENQLAALAPGGQTTVTMAYISSSAGLIVETVLASDDGEYIPLPGVGLTLRRKSSGMVAGTAVTSGRRTVFSDMTLEQPHVLDITPPPHYQGCAVELEDPTQQGASVVVGPDYPAHPLVLRFRKALCQVEGSVLREGGRAAWRDIEVVLKSLAGKEVRKTTTGPDGNFRFDGVHPGMYLMELADPKILHGHDQWVPAPPLSQKVHARPGIPFAAGAFVLERDEHTLTIHTFDSDGKPLPFAPVEVKTESGAPFKSCSTDETGEITVDVRKAGRYQVLLRDTNEVLKFVDVNSNQSVDMFKRQDGGNLKWVSPPSGPTETTIDIPYPLITEGAMGGSSWAPSGPPSSADLGQTVQEALRSVLNWRSTGFNGDAKGFVAALNQSFTITQTQGHTEFTWTPRSYAAVQSGLGALTGAQASIYTRAKVALDQVTPLLEGLYPLLSDADPQNVEAIRAIVRSGITELVNEFGIEGGPRVLRVDDLFRQLVGLNAPTDPESVGGQLGQLAESFGLNRGQVNTIDEEQNFTNSLIIVDYILSLQQSWLTQRSAFTRGASSNPFLGTQLVLVERALSVVAESVREVYMALDSVFVGKEERQVVELTFPPLAGDPGPSSLFVAELLGWIDQVASNEGPQLIKDGGKKGVISFKPTLERLAALAKGALLPQQTAPNLPKGYRTARVQNALAELADHLNETSSLVNQIQAN